MLTRVFVVLALAFGLALSAQVGESDPYPGCYPCVAAR
jgi:hypothetical protein